MKSLCVYCGSNFNGDPILRPSGAQQAAPTINHINRNVSTFRAGFNYDLNRNHRFVLNHIYYAIDRNEQDMMRSEVERTFIGTRNLVKNITSIAYELRAFDSKFKNNIFTKFYQQGIDRMDPVLTFVENQPITTENKTNSSKTATGYGIAMSYAIALKYTIWYQPRRQFVYLLKMRYLEVQAKTLWKTLVSVQR